MEPSSSNYRTLHIKKDVKELFISLDNMKLKTLPKQHY